MGMNMYDTLGDYAVTLVAIFVQLKFHCSRMGAMPQPGIDLGLCVISCYFDVASKSHKRCNCGWVRTESEDPSFLLYFCLRQRAKLTIQRAADHMIAKDNQSHGGNQASAYTIYGICWWKSFA